MLICMTVCITVFLMSCISQLVIVILLFTSTSRNGADLIPYPPHHPLPPSIRFSFHTFPHSPLPLILPSLPHSYYHPAPLVCMLNNWTGHIRLTSHVLCGATVCILLNYRDPLRACASFVQSERASFLSYE